MSLTLTVDGDRWRAHLRGFAEATPGLVPVAKGNGYGFTPRPAGPQGRSGWASTRSRSAPTRSCPRSRSRYAGDLLVLTPVAALPPRRPTRPLARRVIHTVSRPDDLADLLDAQPERPVRARARDVACAGTA